MATGAQYAGRCYSSQPDAVDAYYTSSVPHITAGSTSYYVYVTKVNGNWLSVTSYKNWSGNWIAGTPVNLSAPTFPVCDPYEQFFDGMTVGWAVAGVMAIAWGAREIRRRAR